jgi:hypothetical protein
MNKFNFLLVLLFAMLLIVSCGKEDTVPPTWAFNTFIPEAQSGEVCGQEEPEVFFVKGGDIFEFEALFSDDQELSQYKIDIHQNFDCHGHSKTSDWSVLEVIDLSGTEELVNKQLVIPENVTAGNYHFSIQLLDAAGNQAENSFIRDFIVLNPSDTISPVVDLTSPNLAENIVIERGNALNFTGTVTDNLSLYEGGNGKIVIDFINQSNQNIFEGTELLFPPSLSNSFNFDVDVSIPLSVPSGNYLFRVYATDGVNNESEITFINVEIE